MTTTAAPVQLPGAATTSPRSGTPIVLLATAVAFAISLHGHGRLLVAHIAFVVLLPVVTTTALQEPVLRKLWLVSGIWTAAILMSHAILGGTLWSQYLAASIFVPLTTAGLVWLRRALRIRPSTLAAGVAAGWILLALSTKGSQFDSNPWKFGLEAPCSVLVLALIYSRRSPGRGLALGLLVISTISYAFDSRFYTLVSVLTLAILIAIRGQRHTNISRRGFSLVTVVALVALYVAYPVIARHGWIGQRALQQQRSFDGSGSNYLLSNRMEMPQALYLTVTHPLFGIGTNVPLSEDEAGAALRFASNAGRPLDENDRARLLGAGTGGYGFAPHSAALDTTANAGLLALPFWIFVMFEFRRQGRRLRQANAPGLVLFMMLVSLWDAFFSPFVPSTILGLTLVLFLLVETQPDLRRTPGGRPDSAAAPDRHLR